MPAPSTLKINEIFWSIQGEGLKSGLPSVFIRLAGCSLKCPYCDSMDSWSHSTFVSVSEILKQVEEYRAKYPASQVTITGGEPLEQDLAELVTALKGTGLVVALETNGLHFQDLPLDWWTVSPKDVSDYSTHPDLTERISEVKLVVRRGLNLNKIGKIRDLRDDFTLFLQPEFHDLKKFTRTYNMFEKCQAAGMKNIRLGVQLHRVFDLS